MPVNRDFTVVDGVFGFWYNVFARIIRTYGKYMKIASKIVVSIAGLFLIVAACFKVHQLLTEPLPTEPLIDTWLFSVIQIPLELGLGIWLVSGLFRKAGWLIALIGYACFVGITTWRLATGQESCGCFGSFHVPPKITLFAIDIPIFLALAIFRPKGEKFLPPPWPTAKHFLSVAIPTFIILAILVPTVALNQVTVETHDIDIIDPTIIVEPPVEPVKPVKPVAPKDPNVEPIEPIKLAANEWKYLKKIDIADTIRKGMNITLLYREDCPECHEAIPIFEQYAEQFGIDEDSIRVALVELPPYGDPSHSLIPQDTKCLTGKYIADKVFGATPIIVITDGGVLVKGWKGSDPTPTFDDLMDAMTSE